MITKQQQQWFNELYESNSNASNVFKRPEWSNAFSGVIDKYSDSAHFIFEMLQNADDAKATEVSMQLEKDKFIFTHNGTVRFTISDPDTIVQDRKAGKLGHINSICYIGFSSKSGGDIEVDMQSKIGKFGVGFKAVFQYTNSPEIYDDPFCFRIEDCIVPSAIDNTIYQKQDHTVFVIPFNRKDITPQRAYEEIYQKLRELNYPQLFLNHIKKISWSTATENNTIVKKLDIEGVSHYINYGLYSLSNSFKNEKKIILLLSKSVEIPDQGVHDISIGYYIDKGRIQTKETRNINCFFPTNENIGTCYVIHAPFALVDNREQLKRNNNINDFLFEKIAELAADSLLVLRDWTGKNKIKLLGDNIVHLIKYDTQSIDGECHFYIYTRIEDKFRKNYKRIFDNEPIFLSRQEEYLTMEKSWWADKDTRELLDDTQIERLTQLSLDNSSHYGFVLNSINRTELENSNIELDILDGDELANKITSEFMKEQTNSWLIKFYTFIKEKNLIRQYEINKGNKSTAPMRYANIIKVQTGEFVPAYNDKNELQVFYSEDGTTNPNRSVNTSLAEECAPFREILKDLDVKSPNQLDKLRIKIEKIQEISQEENNELIISIVKFYNSCSKDVQSEIIQLVKEKFLFHSVELNFDEHKWWVSPNKLYEDIDLIKEYYIASGLRKKYFIDTPYYESAINTLGESVFNEFISNLGLKQRPSYSREEVSLFGNEWYRKEHKRVNNKIISMIEGLDIILSDTLNENISEELSHYIWDLIVLYSNNHSDFFKNNTSTYLLYNSLYTQDWGRSNLIDAIRSSQWFYINGERRSLVDGIYKEELNENGYFCDGLIVTNLKIESTPNVREAEAIQEMSEETRNTFALGQELQKEGFSSVDEVRRMKEELEAFKRKEAAEVIAKEERQARNERRKREKEAFSELPSRKKSNGIQSKDFDTPDNKRVNPSHSKSEPTRKSIDEILEGFEEKAKVEREEFEQIANLRERIIQAEKYSFDWLACLMQLEVRSQGGNRASGKTPLYIKFDNITVNPKNDRMIILTDPSRIIPTSLEEMDDLPISFVFNNGSKDTIIFESISVKENCLVLIHNTSVVDEIKNNLNHISFTFTEVNTPIELLSEWQHRVNELSLEPNDSVKAKLREDIEFIFGPPGTGKTTTLAKRIYDIIAGNEKEMKILVLAPTNKACDVLTRKLLEVTQGDDSWIWRFEKTDEPYLEEQEVVYKRDSQISMQRKVCVVSTIARYAFDGFEDGLLRNLKWDYLFIDEASMIPLYQILPPLYNPLMKNIIVSGDPFQIEPIVNIDLWKGENIYTMINLNNFVNPVTEPVQFKVTPLMTQYRSIPKIGELFSNYLYGGKLKHNRTESEHRVLNMGIKESPLNIISFPVGKESIFDLKRLSGSNIQIYSVIFTIEFLKYISRKLYENHKEDSELIKIGVISPYSAEIQAIQKIYNQSCPIYDNIDVVFGSAHGFQGDQCDIIIAVMNPPASGLKRDAEKTFINNRNIINVAISRASDYLFLLIPEKEFVNFDSLYQIKNIGRKMVKLGSEIYSNDSIEEFMFDESMHIERITYVTSHKMTNVFNNPFSPYEIRIDENAIDIQINDI